MSLHWEPVIAWTETRKTHSWVARPTTVEECLKVIEQAKEKGLTICPRGSGYSFGDMILNDGAVILDTSRMNQILKWDEQTGRIVVEPGVRVAQIFNQVLSSCWTLPSCTGGMGVTMGGAVSNNVHGKDSWKIGNFGDHVQEIKLLTAQGNLLRIQRQDAESMKALIGGMGLLGVIVEVTLQLVKIPSPFVEVTSIPVRNIAESVQVIEESRPRSDFLIAWVDAFARGKGTGRGTVETARWVETPRSIDPSAIRSSLIMPSRLFGILPANLVWNLGRPFFHPALIMAANALKYYKDKRRGRRRSEALFTDFNFMLNKIPGWKALYQPHGYLEFQPMIPRKDGPAALEEVLKMCQKMNAQSLLCAIKPHPQDDYYLSYEGDGYSIGIDIALKGRKTASVTNFSDTLYRYIADLGGKTFLAKDEVLSPEIFKRMYPNYKKFLETKKRLDPEGLFASDMQRRLLT